MRPVYLLDLPSMTPREVAQAVTKDEKEIQNFTLILEIKRAEKRYAASVWIPKRQKWGIR